MRPNNPYNWRKVKDYYESPAGRFRAYVNDEDGRAILHDTKTGELTAHLNLMWAQRHVLSVPGPKDCLICRQCQYWSTKAKCDECGPEIGTYKLSEFVESKTEFVRTSSGSGYYRLKRRYRNECGSGMFKNECGSGMFKNECGSGI